MKTPRPFYWHGYLYLLQCGEFFKIGFSVKPRKRLRQLRTGSPFPITVIHELRTAHYKMLEKQLHYKFAAKREKGEWFRLTPEDVAYIKSLNDIGRTPEQERKHQESNANYHAAREAERNAEQERQLSVLLSGLASGAGLCLDLEDAA